VINLEVIKNCLLKNQGFAKSNRKMFIIVHGAGQFRAIRKTGCKLSFIYHHVKKESKLLIWKENPSLSRYSQ